MNKIQIPRVFLFNYYLSLSDKDSERVIKPFNQNRPRYKKLHLFAFTKRILKIVSNGHIPKQFFKVQVSVKTSIVGGHYFNPKYSFNVLILISAAKKLPARFTHHSDRHISELSGFTVYDTYKKYQKSTQKLCLDE